MNSNLILTRKINEMIVIDDDIEITIVEINKGRVRLSINAPSSITIHQRSIRCNHEQETSRVNGIFE